MASQTILGEVGDFVVIFGDFIRTVTRRTRPGPGVVARMAGTAHAVGVTVIQREVVSKRRAAPGVGVVTLAALAREMVRRPIGCVAGRAIRRVAVIEVGGQPGHGTMAQAALSLEVISGLVGRVAGEAIRQAQMIDAGG